MPTTADELRYSTVTRIAGASEQHALDVRLLAGLQRAATESVSCFTSLSINNYNLTANSWVMIFNGSFNVPNPCGLLICNPSDAYDVFLNITTSSTTGILVPPRTTILFNYIGTAPLYARCSNNTTIVVAQIGV